MVTVKHIAEPPWNIIAAELVAFARLEAVDRARMKTDFAQTGQQLASVRRILLTCINPAENHADYAEQ